MLLFAFNTAISSATVTEYKHVRLSESLESVGREKEEVNKERDLQCEGKEAQCRLFVLTPSTEESANSGSVGEADFPQLQVCSAVGFSRPRKTVALRQHCCPQPE